MKKTTIPEANDSHRKAIGKLAESGYSLGSQCYELETQFQRRLCQSFGVDAQGQSLGKLNNKA